jgi:hypothetical protein
MGTTFQHRGRGQSDRQFFQDLMGTRYTILECATMHARTEDGAFYAAVQTNEGPEQGQVWAFVALVYWTFGYHNFGYKDMEETMGPNAAECPARILDLLTPLGECSKPHPHREHDYCGTCAAREWRADCRKVADARARAAKVQPGQVIKFAKPITFASGTELDTLTFEARDTFRADGLRYRIRGWRTMTGWELVPAC